MKTDISHLPAAKQRELDRVVQILHGEFGDIVVHAEGKRKAGRILKIILFGSHARNDWVNEPLTGKGDVSDFDLLVIVNQADLTDLDLWDKADERLSLELYILKKLRTPVNFIVHTLKEVNDVLAKGTAFHIDLVRDGIALYELNDSELHQPIPAL